MTETGIYLIKASFSMALLYGIYWFLLRKETTFQTNRIYLLLSLIVSLILPVISIRYMIMDSDRGIIESINSVIPGGSIASKSSAFPEGISGILMFIYICGVIVFLFRIIWQASVLFYLRYKNGVKEYSETKVVENTRFTLPFSFLRIVFINPHHIRKTELDEIIAHEKVHIRENHWLDLLLVELMTIILWFNPFIWFYERSIKQNHEYLADEGVIAQGNSIGRYHSVLINQLMGMEVIGITNNLNYSLNAKRLKMMKRKKTPRLRALNCLWALPIVALLLAAFAQPQVENELLTSEFSVNKDVTLTCVVLDSNGDAVPGATVTVKGKKTGTVTDAQGVFELKLSNDDIVIVKFMGFEDQAIYMKKIVAKEGESDSYKLKIKMAKKGAKETLKPNGADDEVANLEKMLKELTMKKADLEKMKQKISDAEKKGDIDPKVLEEKKANLKKSYMAVDEKIKKVKAKLKDIQK